MYSIETFNKKVQKELEEYVSSRIGIKNKLKRLEVNPRKENGAHPLHGKLAGKWACWLGSNLRVIYIIDDKSKVVVIEAVGTHKIY